MNDKYTRESAKDSLTREANRELGICEQIRQVYDSVYKMTDEKLKEEITEKLIDALIMAKKMGDRLTYYYEKTHETSGHLGTNLKPINQQKLLKMRRKRK
jgi:NTP pyrophosphatase (non-canonical NTP hydrolase)